MRKMRPLVLLLSVGINCSGFCESIVAPAVHKFKLSHVFAKWHFMQDETTTGCSTMTVSAQRLVVTKYLYPLTTMCNWHTAK